MVVVGALLLITLNHTNLNQELFMLDVQTGALRSLTEHLGRNMFQSAQFSPDEQSLYFSADMGRDFRALWRMPLSTLQPELSPRRVGTWKAQAFAGWETLAYVVNEGGRFIALVSQYAVRAGTARQRSAAGNHRQPDVEPGQR